MMKIRTMLGFAVALALCFTVVSEASAQGLINGAGATFPYPLYAKWAFEYNKKTGVKMNYQSIGSGGGIKQVKTGTVDFGASDAPLVFKDLDDSGLIQFPMAVGGVVPVVNVVGVKTGQLKLTPEVLSDIYMGKIKKWNDVRITGPNPGLALPDDSITVVHRSDGSGTTWIFTNYLDKVSKGWHDRVGFGTSVDWPVGVGGKGNEGVATYVKRIKNTIGYVEFAYAVQNRLAYARLENRDRVFVEPSMESFGAAAANADWKGTPGFAVILTDQPGKNAWPISGATFILVPKSASNCSNSKAVLDFFDWAYKSGADMAKSLDFVPVSQTVYAVMEDAWAKEIKCNGVSLWRK